MFNIIGNGVWSSSRRDDHGVGELLAAASRRSSCNENERQQLEEMARRVRTSRPHHPPVKKTVDKAVQESPSSSTHGSSDGGSEGSSSDIGFNSDTSRSGNVDLLRGFGPSSSSSSSPLHTTPIADQHRSNGILLRDFGHPPEKDDDDDDRSCDSYGY